MMSKSFKFADLGAASIHQVVIALSAAQKLKQFSSNLVLQRRRNADKGNFEVTYEDDPMRSNENNKSTNYTPQRKSTTSLSPLAYALEAGQPPLNTYRLEPTKKFEVGKVQGIIKETFEQELSGKEYSKELCSQMTTNLCDLIKQKVKSLQFPRYKILVVVYIGQKSSQNVRVASRCVWDTRFDDFAQYVYEGLRDIFATGIVYAIYQE